MLMQQNLEARVGIGLIFPPYHLKYARFHWVFKQKRFYPILSFLIRLVSVLVSALSTRPNGKSGVRNSPPLAGK
jgi:hypothetical protein